MREQWKRGFAALTLLGVTALAAGCGGSKDKEKGDEVAELAPRLGPGDTTSQETMAGAVTVTPVSFADAEAAYNTGEYDKASVLFKAYTTDRPENPWGHYMFGLSAWKSRDLDQAEGELLKAIELDPAHVKSRYNLARVYLEKGVFDKATEQIESGIKLDSTSSEGFRLLGRVRDALGMPVEAVEAYKQAVKIDGQDAWAVNNLGVNLIGQGKPDEAIGVLVCATELRPESATFHNNLGMALELAGYFKDAAQAYQTAVGIDQTYQKAIDNLARVSGHEDKPGIPPLDLKERAKAFVSQL